MSIEGVDYSTRSVNPAVLAGQGKKFAGRYLGPGSADKHLTAEEASSILRAGLSIVGLVEGAVHDPLGGRTVGVDHALSALRMARDVGAPSSMALYFAVDWDVQDHEWPNVADYFRGVASVMPWRNIGIYGGANAIRWAKRDGLAAWFMQTYGWSHGEWIDGVHIEQYSNNVSGPGAMIDLCRAMTDHFGQWGDVTASPPDSPGGSMSTAQDVWDFAFPGPSQGMPPTSAGDWLKYGQSAYTEAQAAHQAVKDLAGSLNGLATKSDVGAIQLAIQEIARMLGAAMTTPPIDAVAVARAIVADPTIARDLATAVAQQLATITGQITLSGSLTGGITPPAV